MGNFFSSRWFLEASADCLLPGAGAVPRTVTLGGLAFDTLVLPSGAVAGNPMADFLEPRPGDRPSLDEPLPVPFLERASSRRVAVARPPVHPAGLLPSPCIDWGGFDSWEDYVKQTSKRQWRAFKLTKRKRRKLVKLFGAVEIELDRPDHDLVEQLLIHKARQLRATGGLDRFVSRRVRQLVHRLVEDRHLQLSVLSGGGRPLAFALAHWGEHRLGSWIVSYDPEASAVSPGTQLYEAMMAESYARGHREFDFLIGAEPYKYHYATHERLVGPMGTPPLTQRLSSRLRRELEADARPRRVRQFLREAAMRAAQERLTRQAGAPIDDSAYRAAMDATTPGWPGPPLTRAA